MKEIKPYITKVLKVTSGGFHSWVMLKLKDGSEIKVKKENINIPDKLKHINKQKKIKSDEQI